ncbi:MAG: VOC family protein [Pseudomonadota bacterium]
MIVPNLLVSNLPRSVEFYRSALGFDLMMVLTATNEMIDEPGHPEAVFATMAWGDDQLMLQTRAHLEDAGVSQPAPPAPVMSGSLYLRDFDFTERIGQIPQAHIARQPTIAWYGMRELVIEDPDGYRIVLGHRSGPPPL